MRARFYDIAEKFENDLQKDKTLNPMDKGWDDLTICKQVNTALDSDERPKLETLYIDECQDLTYSQICVLFAMLNTDVGQVACAGDLAQSVQPSSFTWQC